MNNYEIYKQLKEVITSAKSLTLPEQEKYIAIRVRNIVDNLEANLLDTQMKEYLK